MCNKTSDEYKSTQNLLATSAVSTFVLTIFFVYMIRKIWFKMEFEQKRNFSDRINPAAFTLKTEVS
jgi:hypothetical protein